MKKPSRVVRRSDSNAPSSTKKGLGASVQDSSPRSGREETPKTHFEDAQNRLSRTFEDFRDRLLKTDWTNPAVRLRKTSTRSSFDLAPLSTLYASLGEKIVVRGSTSEGRECLVKHGDLDEKAVEARAQLYDLERTVRLSKDETGVYDLYVGFPFLRGHLTDGHHLRGPLILFPARLTRKSDDKLPGWYVEFSDSRPPIANHALFETLRKKQSLDLMNRLEDKLPDIFQAARMPGKDFITDVSRQLAEFFSESGVEVSGVSKSEDVELQPLSVVTGKSQAEGNVREPLSIECSAVLGRFPQGSTSIFEDYQDLLDRVTSGNENLDKLKSVILKPTSGTSQGVTQSPTVPPSVDEQLVNAALPSDPSQDLAILAANANDYLLVRGPPGTGKSQLIVNLITHSLFSGNRVLVVCQKRPALDVVFERLQRISLEKHVAIVHDSREDRKNLYSRLAQTYETIEAAPPRKAPTTSFSSCAKEILKTVNELNLLVEQFHAERPCGASLQELYAVADPNLPRTGVFRGVITRLTLADLDAILHDIDPLVKGFHRFDSDKSHLKGARPFSQSAFQRTEDASLALVSVLGQCGDRGLICLENITTQEGVLSSIRYYRGRLHEFTRYFRRSWWHARKRVLNLLDEHELDEGHDPSAKLLSMVEAGQRFYYSIRTLEPYVTAGVLDGLLELVPSPAPLKARLEYLLKCVPELPSLLAYDSELSRLTEPARDAFLSWMKRFPDIPEQVASLIRNEMIHEWIHDIEQSTPLLQVDGLEKYLRLQHELQGLVDKKRKLVVEVLSAKLEARVKSPPLTVGEENSAAGDRANRMKEIIHEFTKKSRVRPIRELLGRYSDDFFNLAPCWLTSPEAVSDIFPLSEGLFDLVIFDEASQLAVERSVPACYRGKHVVIAGDEKQLPPFDLFQLGESESLADDDEGPQYDADSLLDLARQSVQACELSWHYRSDYQELIDFSNRVFYRWRLNVCPNSQRGLSIPPVQFIHVRGSWENSRNEAEADEVVNQIRRILTEARSSGGKVPSIGVITFNDEQRRLVEGRIDQQCQVEPEFNTLYQAVANAAKLDDRPFVKNIERVQGDERDVILFSVGYAPGPEGKFPAHFGTLNLQGGENRMNVAITRARTKMIVLASFDPDQVDLSRTTNRGPKILEGFLRYAKAISLKDDGKLQAVYSKYGGVDMDDQNPPESNRLGETLEPQLHRSLTATGLGVDKFIGRGRYRIGVGVIHPQNSERYAVGIECDGKMFTSASSSLERDVTRPRFLEQRGWNIERSWSQRWFRDRSQEVSRLQSRVQEVVKSSPKSSSTTTPDNGL